MRERSLLDDCVHCGFCLPACPTYVSWGEEMDSPRGRIDLMRGLAEGKIEWSENVAAHFDRCLGCMGCMPACPSGVKYDVLIEGTRAELERRFDRPLAEQFHRGMIFALFPYPARLRAAAALLWLYTESGLRTLVRKSGLLRLLPKRLARMEALLPPVSLRDVGARLPERVAAKGERRARVALLSGCVQRVFFPGVNEATLSVLSAEGCEVLVPPEQGCCGALSIHAGREPEALGFARQTIAAFEEASRDAPLDAILVNAAGCGSNMKDYGRLLAHDPKWAAKAAAFSSKVRDVSEYLADLPPLAPRRPIRSRVAYHDSCHLANAQRIREQPRKLLAGIPGLQLVEIPDGDQCCGSAGIYNLVEPEASEEIGVRKADNVLSVKPDLLASGNPGCTLQIQKILRERGIKLRAAHPVEILDASISGRPLPE
ncbi:MAG TPA: heterodisulfide reductase-related iron-sulfur binding cluster [Thermoanaerobaculia bacterium]|nr:heterodisulfide reductase-related iron-sulfur binding cluster [Thermoanaerobaculia bacterium]